MSGIVLRHSYSALKQFENCPKRYFHQRVEKTVKDVGGEASLHGERVHKSFEDRIKHGTPLPDALRHHEQTVQQLLDFALLRAWNVEAEAELTVNSFYKPTGWWSDDAWLRAKLDLVLRGKRAAALMDWKTGKRRPDFLQMDIFAFMLFLHYPELEVVTTSFYWLPEQVADSKVYKREDEPALLVALTSRVHRIETSLAHQAWPAKPSGLCKFCPCASFCEFKFCT